jgi:hypothetical protein
MQWMAVFTEEDTLSDGDDDAAEAWGYVQHRNPKVTLEVISPTAHHADISCHSWVGLRRVQRLPV